MRGSISHNMFQQQRGRQNEGKANNTRTRPRKTLFFSWPDRFCSQGYILHQRTFSIQVGSSSIFTAYVCSPNRLNEEFLCAEKVEVKFDINKTDCCLAVG